MRGEITGGLAVVLESTPTFEAHLVIEGADLEDYAKSLPGKQGYRGKVSGRVDLSGMGGDLHTLQEARQERTIAQGDLGRAARYLGRADQADQHLARRPRPPSTQAHV